MAVIGLQPIMMKDATLTIAGDDYTASITQVLFVPQVEWLWADTFQATEPVFARARWTSQVGFLQDWETANALTSYLILNAAQRRTVVFTPKVGGMTVTADVLLIPASVGGVPGQQMSATAVLPLFGDPVLTGM